MREYLPVLIVGAIIGTFALVFILALIAKPPVTALLVTPMGFFI